MKYADTDSDKPNKMKRIVIIFVCLGLALSILCAILYPLLNKKGKETTFQSYAERTGFDSQMSNRELVYGYPDLSSEIPDGFFTVNFQVKDGFLLRDCSIEEYTLQTAQMPHSYILAVKDNTYTLYMFWKQTYGDYVDDLPAFSDDFMCVIPTTSNFFNLNTVAQLPFLITATTGTATANGITFNFFQGMGGYNFWPLEFWFPPQSDVDVNAKKIVVSTRSGSFPSNNANYGKNIINADIDEFYRLFSNPDELAIFDKYGFSYPHDFSNTHGVHGTEPPTEPDTTEPTTILGGGDGTSNCGHGNGCGCNVVVNNYLDVNNNQEIVVTAKVDNNITVNVEVPTSANSNPFYIPESDDVFIEQTLNNFEMNFNANLPALNDIKISLDNKLPIWGQSVALFNTFTGTLSNTSNLPPDVEVKLYGVSARMIDFDIYDNYRPFIHGIILALSYFFFIKRLFIKLPKAVGGTS